MNTTNDVYFLTQKYSPLSEESINKYAHDFSISSFARDSKRPVLIDLTKATELYTANPSAEGLQEALIQSRISFMGTDGMRGKTELRKTKNCFSSMMKEHILTKEILELSTFAFAQMLIRSGKISPGDSVCTGNDGRDLATGWEFNTAMKDGFLKCGINVIDLGIIPTPYVPLYMQMNGLTGAAMLTASHNPSNQNGIKFFFEGKKILPEGDIGDYTLSALMFQAAGLLQQVSKRGACTTISFKNECLSFLEKNISPSYLQKFKTMHLFLDCANGAYTEIAERFFTEKGISYTSVNEKPSGTNINQHCGVAEIEGCSLFERKHAASSIRIVQLMFDRANDDPLNRFGIVLDGDGDRGFVLFYNKEKECIHVLDGDICGYLVALFLKKTKATTDGVAVFTVESDIMASAMLHKKEGISTKTVDVGDKWICNFTEKKMLIGLESSGHLIIPTAISVPGGSKELRAGNGFLSALMTLCAIQEYNSCAHPFYEPFSTGFSRTFYTYFIDKTRFTRNSAVWKRDIEIIHSFLTSWIQKRTNSCSATFKQDDKMETNMLYFSLYENNELVASIFSRNSGTEDKNALYLKCRNDLSSSLLPVMETLLSIHRKELKNSDSLEKKCEDAILEILKNTGPLSLAQLTEKTGNSLLVPVLYALCKQKILTYTNDIYAFCNETKGVLI